MAVALRLQSASRCHHLHRIGRHTWHTDTHGIGITGIQHIHHVGSYGCRMRRRNHTIGLRKRAAKPLSLAIAHGNITRESVLAKTRYRESILPIGRGERSTTHDNLRSLRRVNRRHHDRSLERFAGIEGGFLGNDISIELIHPHIVHIDICHQRMQHLAFRVAHVALQLRKLRDNSRYRHVFKTIFLPVLALPACLLWYRCSQIAADDAALLGVIDHREQLVSILIDGVEKFVSATCARRKHHDVGRFYIVFMANSRHIAIATIGLLHQSHLQIL